VIAKSILVLKLGEAHGETKPCPWPVRKL